MKPYIPNALPVKNLNYEKIIGLVGRANAELARYDGLLQAIVNPEILLSPLTTNEAVLSSKIEGTQATLDEVLKFEAGMDLIEERKEQDVQEIVNYRSTLILAEQELKDRPLSLFLVRQMHKELMDSVRGANKQPGEFRTTQNWIGKLGTPIDRAVFVPPEPSVLQDYLGLFEKYIQTDDSDILMQSAVVHAQFELLHPFLDGNGRIGRLLIPLFLYYKKALSRPMFYLSAYLENYRDEYYIHLREISDKSDWDGWVKFYLNAVLKQSIANSAKVKEILDHYFNMRDYIVERTRSRYAHQLLDAIFDKPIFRSSDIQIKSKIPKQSLMPMLKQLLDDKILLTLRPASGRMPAVLVFQKLLEITEDKPIQF
ncbi:MAG: Fic family protein [Candidatus Marinimicrobia bacterium]|nr:Fic family protein [Candidatus Neomarinimicrobiota bacterium]